MNQLNLFQSKKDYSQMPIKDIVKELGYELAPSKFEGCRDVIKDGKVVFTGRALQVYYWFKETNQI